MQPFNSAIDALLWMDEQPTGNITSLSLLIKGQKVTVIHIFDDLRLVPAKYLDNEILVP